MRFAICPSCRTVGYVRRSSTCQARRSEELQQKSLQSVGGQMCRAINVAAAASQSAKSNCNASDKHRAEQLVHRQTEITAMFSKETIARLDALAQTRRLAKSHEGVARKGTTRLVATTNESRERECCRCDYVQTRRVNESCVWHVDGKEIMICGQRPAGLICACAGLWLSRVKYPVQRAVKNSR